MNENQDLLPIPENQEYLVEGASPYHLMTDDQIRDLGYKESVQYPGYFEGDPRHPPLTVEDRYLLDHPGPHWTTKRISQQETRLLQAQAKRLRERRLAGEPRYDSAQFSGEAITEEQPFMALVPDAQQPPPPPFSSGTDPEVQQKGRQTGLWICQVCRRDFARWPTERTWATSVYGLLLRVTFRSPYACTQCRIMRFRHQQALGHQNHRDFWTKVIDLWEGGWRRYLLRPRPWFVFVRGARRERRPHE